MKEMTHMQKNLLITLSVLCAIYILSSLSGILNPNTSLIRSSNADIIVYKSETCGCCNDWIDHLENNNFIVETFNREDMNLVKLQLGGVPSNLQSCHTAKIGDYIVEGHVHAEQITRMLKEKPDIKGLSVPGMPMGSPGMEGYRNDAYDVLAFNDDDSFTVYASYNQ